MATGTEVVKTQRMFYGWWLLAAGTTVAVLYSVFFAVGLGVYFPPVIEEFQTSRAALSWVFALMQLENGLLGPVEGYMVDKLGTRKVMFLGLFLLGVGLIWMSQAGSLSIFLAAFLIIALGGGLAGFLPISAAVTNWFVRHRSIAMGIALAGFSAGGLLLPALAWSISTYGWRDTAFGSALILWIVGFPLVALIRHRPEPYGYRPDGDPPSQPTAASLGGENEEAGLPSPTPPQEEQLSLTPIQAMKTSAFWVIGIAHSLAVLMVGAVMVHLVQFVVDLGTSLVVASTVVTVTTGVSIVGRLVGGFLGDRVSKVRILVVAFLLQAAGMLVLSFATQLWQAMLFAVIFGLGWGTRGPLLIAIRGDYFGRRYYATIMGLSQPMLMVGLLVGPLMAGYAYDILDSYQSAFIVIALANLLGAFLLVFLHPPKVATVSKQPIG